MFSFFKYLQSKEAISMKRISYEIKKKKLDRIRHILRDDMPYTENDAHYNFLSQELREQ
jgi:hypothetical protein